MGKRISKTAAASDFATTTSSIAATAITMAPDTAETMNPTVNSVVDTSKGAVNRHLKSLDSAVSMAKRGFLGIGFNLHWFKDTLTYQSVEGKEYPTIEAFAKDRYDISRSTTLAYIAVVEKFGRVNPGTGEIDALKDEYKDYSPTALITMCAMDDETIAKCKPNMKVKDLKALMTAKDDDENDGDKSDDAGSKDGSPDDSGESDSADDDGDENDINATTDNTLKGIRILSINTVAELEDKKEYIFDVMKKILSQKTAVDYTVGVFQLEPPEIAK